MINKTMSATLITLLIATNSYALDEYYNKSKEGWFFYKDDKIKKDEKKDIIKQFDNQHRQKSRLQQERDFMRSIPINKLDSLTTKEFRQTFEKAKDIAAMRPTQENVFVVQKMNSFMTNRSVMFAEQWQRNNLIYMNELLKDNTQLDQFQSKYVTQDENKKDKEDFEKLINDGLEYIVFYEEKDPKTSKLKEILSKYMGFTPIVHYINIKEAKNIQKQYNLTVFPEIFSKTNKEDIKHIYSGIATAEALRYFTKLQYSNYFRTMTKVLKDEDMQ